MALTPRVDRRTVQHATGADAPPPLIDAALRCIARWGVAKTSFDDIAREAGVSRATAYRAFPGGKERLLDDVLDHELRRFVDGVEAELAAAGDLAELLSRGIARALAAVAGHPSLRTLVDVEPERVLPHFAFHRLDRYLAAAVELCRPHLRRFVSEDDVTPLAEWAARIVLTYSIHPSPAVDPQDPASIRHLVEIYVLPALAAPVPAS